jgi:hypothetical protein
MSTNKHLIIETVLSAALVLFVIGLVDKIKEYKEDLEATKNVLSTNRAEEAKAPKPQNGVIKKEAPIPTKEPLLMESETMKEHPYYKAGYEAGFDEWADAALLQAQLESEINLLKRKYCYVKGLLQKYTFAELSDRPFMKELNPIQWESLRWAMTDIDADFNEFNADQLVKLADLATRYYHDNDMKKGEFFTKAGEILGLPDLIQAYSGG